MEIRYLGGSGFLVTSGDTGLLFDAVHHGSLARLPEKEELASLSRLVIFITKNTEDHYDPAVLDLFEGAEIVITDDLPEEIPGHRLSPGQRYTADDLEVEAFETTDGGVSFLVRAFGAVLFHAGSLNLWHWRDISTVAQIDAAERAFNECLAKIPKNTIDLAFFPVDPRQGSMYDAGAGVFTMTAKPKILIPMHFQDRADAARYFAVTNATKSTRIEVLEKAGDTMSVQFEKA